MENTSENKYTLVPKDILDACEFESDYTDAWELVEKKIENINTLKGFFKDYGKNSINLENFFMELSKDYISAREEGESSFYFWFAPKYATYCKVYIKLSTDARINYDEDRDGFEEIEDILKRSFPRISQKRIDSILYFYAHTGYYRKALFDEIDRQLNLPSTTSIYLEEACEDGSGTSLKFPKSDLF